MLTPSLPTVFGIWGFSRKSIFSQNSNRLGKQHAGIARPKYKVIPANAYNPKPKAPSRRDKHRMEVAMYGYSTVK